MRRLPPLLVAVLTCAIWWGCTEGLGPTGTGRAVEVGIVPNFQVDPALFATSPIDRIRLTARNAATSVVVGSTNTTVSPTADQWTLSLGIDLGGATSLEIVVDAELLSGTVVVWSGRVGPFTVPSSTPARSMEVYPGPLGNQDVTGIDIQGDPAQMIVGTSTSLSANATLRPGSSAVPVVLWASSNPAVATVTAQGGTVTLVAVSPGTADIIATAGPAYDEFTLQVVPIPPFVTWQGTTSDWHTGSNWSSGQVPQASTDVVVPASSLDPVISANTAVADLTIEAGATVTVSNAALDVSGDLVADGDVVGAAASVVLSGASATAEGTVGIPVTVSGPVAASGPLTVADLSIDGAGARFNVNGQMVASLGGLTTLSGGRLEMSTVGSQLTVGGDAYFDGGDTFGLLTNGVLTLSGSFTATDNSSTTFAATGSHLVVFEGTADRTVHFDAPGQNQQHFFDVGFDLTGVVTATSELMAWGAVSILNGTVDAGSQTVSIGGALYDPNSGLTYGTLRLFGDVGELPPGLTGPVIVDAAVDWPNDVIVTGDVTVLGILDLGTTTLTVLGDMLSNGALVVPSGGLVSITGLLTLGSGSNLDVDGTITATLGCVDNGAATITGTGTHPCGSGPAVNYTWVGGADPDPFDWDDPLNWSPVGVPGPSSSVLISGAAANPRLGGNTDVASITVSGLNSVDLNSSVLVVTGDVNANNNGILNGFVEVTGAGSLLQGAFDNLRVSADRSLTGQTFVFTTLRIENVLDTNGQVLSVGEMFVEGPNARLLMTDPQAVVVASGNAYFSGADHTDALTEGYLSVGGDFYASDASPTAFVSSGNHVVALNGGGTQNVAFDVPGATQQRFGQATISGIGGVTFSTDAYASDDVFVSGRMIVPVGTTVTIGGGLTLGAGATFEVYGTVVATGCTDLGALILGDGMHDCGAPSTADRVWVGGVLGFESEWSDAGNWSPVGVPTSTDAVLIPSTLNPPVLSSDQTVAGIEVLSTTVLDLGTFRLIVTGDARVDGVITNGITEVNGAGSVLQGNFDELILVGPDRSLSGSLATVADLTVLNSLEVGPYQLVVNGALTVQNGNAGLAIDNSSGFVYVLGNALFNGGSLDGYLTGGQLYLLGDLTVGNSFSQDAFKTTGTAVYVAGDANQTFSFSNPGPGAAEQSFSDLYVLKDGGSLVLDSDVFVTGLLYADTQTIERGVSGTLEVTGTLDLTSVTFDGLQLRLVSSVAPNLHTMNSVTFANMADDVTQLYVQLPGAGPNTQLLLTSPTFSPNPPVNGFYIEGINSTAGVPLYIELTNPSPVGNIGIPASDVDVNTVLVWP